ncbi:penicillin-binding protein 1C [Candidatus Curtissbacteria bacterium RIFCSPLOWO2_01_FULL_39_62]|uniref:Penicillin-binding protein 1C n=2 Tax=Candidatus Curtissiibacteriota TaxID=1752717 RepID=A0A1F5GA63_9BACT|nr:MAG: penicillin-binding protein 1C [Candidatus Curtissbacteria bacterium RIFCSPHIGHO2_01_FULL_39_57]OGD88773.1 MAG: penicillin-binding protein 1C [Candidatus Curtissbacteria bacterium RIFCSPHIGHO2_02_FULL_40_16b]OGD90529.1 MAG: penicillin-binding protein 1C [Candidatus Curtissbacteria bacterium RIFCSPHIGHO2_12_FULL_38_37]OGE00958.1 MAG: penicillin-binding protein 1C [Candidatus Curtissbacteria bacterium RIFCSPLOWO2_01_FULL_39_62]OGE13900.1 MAG: penicillin-binding protein 1C [Candidatus Curti
MAILKLFGQITTKIIGFLIGFLTWFIRLVTFFGDVTIWTLKQFSKAIVAVFKKARFDLLKLKPVKATRKTLKHPLIHQDRSFKVGLATIFILITVSWFITRDLPSPKQLENREIPQTTKIYDRNGELLFNVYTDENRTLVPLSEVPQHMIRATLAIEDKDFYKHKGFDIYGIVRAFNKTVFQGTLQGGSTITQQLVKSVFLTPERTIDRKLKELYLAFRVEMAFPKDRILEMYLNQVPFGGTAWGVAAAAEQYFGKEVKDLTLAESAMLAGLPAAPSYYSPFGQDPTRAKTRQILVLNRMIEEGYITRDEAEIVSKEELKFQEARIDIKAPHFVMFVREFLAEKYGETVAAHGGLKVTTSLDLGIQEEAQKIVADNVNGLSSFNVGNGAALVTKPKSGEILAMVGSKDFFDVENDGNVNVTVALRQPGSSIKPVNYATALERKLITPATIIIDSPTTFSGGPKPYRPVNYDGKYHGAVSAREALANSYNIPAVKVLALNGVGEMIKQARKMGITTFEDESRYGLSLTLGGGEVRMTEHAEAFGGFANEGERIPLSPILKIEDSSGKIIEEFKQPKGERVLSRETSFLISSILSDNGARSAAFGANSLLNIRGKTVAVKTGTTDDKRDNWTIGYTPSYLVVTWVGNNDNTPMRAVASGITGATPIWNEIMTFILKDKINETFKVPSGVVGTEICGQTGGPKNDSCANRFEYFITGTVPKEDTFKLTKVWVDVTTGQVVEAGSPNAEEKDVVILKDTYSNKDYCVTCPRPEPEPTPQPQQ